MTRRSARLVAAFALTGLVLAACGDDDDDDTAATEAPAASDAAPATDAPAATDAAPATDAPAETDAAPATDAPAETTEATEGGGDDGGSGWAVDTEDCVDPDRANAPIEGTINIASVMPLSGGIAAAAFGPVAQGLEAYIDYANENGLVPGHDLAVTIGDDQYSSTLTPGAVESALDSGAQLFTGIIGTDNNETVRDLLNEECVPQLNALTGSPAWGEVADYPWTTGALVPYTTETQAYVEDIKGQYPDGGTIALFYTNTDFGQIYQQALEEALTDTNFELVDSQTIELGDDRPPEAQLSSIAGNAPDVIVAAPLGSQCPTFMTALANAKATAAGWDPRVYITSTCSSSLILGAAGPNADGLYTSASGGIQDIGNPEVVAANESVKAYVDYMTSKGFGDGAVTAAQGWVVGEITVEILRKAAESPDGLTQASILNAARDLDFVPSLVRPGVEYKTSGEEDPYVAEDIQVIQYDAAGKIFSDVGELNTSFRSS